MEPGISSAKAPLTPRVFALAPGQLQNVVHTFLPKLDDLLQRDLLECTLAEAWAAILGGRRLLWMVNEGQMWLITERKAKFVLIWGLIGEELDEEVYAEMLRIVGRYAKNCGTPVLRAWTRDGLVPFLKKREWRRIHTLMEVEL